jgi:thiamine biosynthesis protein ThiC
LTGEINNNGKEKKDGDLKDAIKGTEAIRNWNDHKLSLSQIEQKFDTNFSAGLTSEKAKKFHQQYGDNALTKKIITPWYCLLAKEMFGGF